MQELGGQLPHCICARCLQLCLWAEWSSTLLMCAVCWCGFVQEAGIPIKLASTIGICVDHRRRNRSLEGLQVGFGVSAVTAHLIAALYLPASAMQQFVSLHPLIQTESAPSQLCGSTANWDLRGGCRQSQQTAPAHVFCCLRQRRRTPTG